MSRYSRLGKNTFLVFIGNMGSKLISLIMLPFYTNWLSVKDYGISDLVLVYVSFLLSIITCCIAEAIFIFPKGQTKEVQKKYFSAGLLFVFMSFMLSAFFFYIIRQAFIFFGEINTFINYTWFIWGIIVMTFLQNYTQQFSRSIDNIKVFTISGVVYTICIASLSFLLIPKFKLDGYFYAQILALFITSLYTFVSIKGTQYILLKKGLFHYCKEMLLFSIPLIPNGIMWWLVAALNRPMMEKNLGLEAVGVFAVANRFPSVIVVLFTVFISSWQISVIEEFKKKGYNEFYNKVLRILFLGLAVAISLMTMFSKQILIIFADPKFYEAWQFIPVLSFAVLFSSLSGFVGTNFSASRESKYYFYSSVWGAISSILFNLLLIPTFGVWGACFSIVLSYMVMSISRIKYSWRYVKIKQLGVYLSMLIIVVFIIVTSLLVESIYLQMCIYTIALISLFLLNTSLFPDIKRLFYLIKNKIS